MSELAQFPTPTRAILIFLMPDLIKLTNYSHVLAWSKIQVPRGPFGFIISIRSGCDCYDRQNFVRGRARASKTRIRKRPQAVLIAERRRSWRGRCSRATDRVLAKRNQTTESPPAVGRARLRR